MKQHQMKNRVLPAILTAFLLAASARGAQPPAAAPAATTPRNAVQTDLTGYWVAQVTEDWRMRMITPPKGDFIGIPLNQAGAEIANSWDLAADNARGDECKAFGAGGIMRQPTRLRISWEDDSTLQVETDLGEQTRLFRFSADQAARNAARSWQGYSAAYWVRSPVQQAAEGLTQAAGLLGGPPTAAINANTAAVAAGNAANLDPVYPGWLKVVTTNLKAGYLRKNGIPYSENAVVTEYYDHFSIFGTDYLQVVTVVEDPTYLRKALVVSNQFKREADGAKWNPQPCRTDPPTVAEQPRQWQ